MPHIIFRGPSDLPAVLRAFTRETHEQEGWIIKLLECYIASNTETLLFECTSVRSGFSQNFYARAEQKGHFLTVRIDPMMRIERNEGVQRTVAVIADVVRKHTGVVFEKSNLPEKILSRFHAAE